MTVCCTIVKKATDESVRFEAERKPPRLQIWLINATGSQGRPSFAAQGETPSAVTASPPPVCSGRNSPDRQRLRRFATEPYLATARRRGRWGKGLTRRGGDNALSRPETVTRPDFSLVEYIGNLLSN